MKASLEMEGERDVARLPCAVSSTDSVTDIGDEPFLAAPMLEIDRGSVLAGRYQIERTIGKGGSGLVLRAFDRIAQQPVAVKILKPELAANPHWVERFSRELRLARQIQHPNVCRVFDIGEADGHKFLTMELGSESTLRAAVRPCAPVRPMADRIADARALVAGMSAIHAAGIVHRDIKPENMLRMEDGRLVVSDFGLATNAMHTPAVTCLVGTPSYMAPEMVMGDPADLRSDVWAIGVVMHEILFGKRPEWEVKNGERTFRPPVAKDASPVVRGLAQLCATCAAESAASRPADAVEVARRFARAEDPATYGLRHRIWRNRRRWGWAPVAVAAIAALILTKDRGWRSAAASSAGMRGAAMGEVIKPQGKPTDWSKTSTLVSRIEGRVHCVSMLPGGDTARIVWGSPRRAEDVDVATGVRRAAKLRPETYERGCPSAAPRGSGLLYEWADGSSAPQIMFSAAPDGSDAKALIKGTDPLWLPGSNEFVFEMDQSHAALFSLPTMSFALIVDDGTVGKKAIFRKAVSSRGDKVAILYIEESNAPRTLVTHALPGLEVVSRFRLQPSTTDIMFDGNRDDLLFSFEESSVDSGIATLDPRSGLSRRAGFVPKFDVRYLLDAGVGQLLVTRRLTSDAWIVGADGTRRRVTSNGESYSSASNGDLALVGTRAPDGRYVITKYDKEDANGTPISAGPQDRMPAISSDQASWFFVSYETNAIIQCEFGSHNCRRIHADPLVPAWPAPSPDGQRVAYVTQLSPLRLRVVPTAGGAPIDLGPALSDCGPIWAGPKHLWSFQVTGSGRAWVEVDALTGERTGRSLPVPRTDQTVTDRAACLRETQRQGSPLFSRTRIETEEISELSRLRL